MPVTLPVKLPATLLAFGFVIAVAFSAPAETTAGSPAGSALPNLPGYTQVNLTRNGENQLLTPVKVNGVDAIFGVDTGAPVTSVDLSNWLRFKLETAPVNSGVPPQIRVAGAPVDMVVIQSLTAGPLRLTRLPAALMNLARANHGRDLRGSQKERIDGILGTDVLGTTQALIDCGQCRMYIKTPKAGPLNPQAFRLLLAQSGYSRVPMQRDAGHVVVSCRIDGMPCRLIVDTGSFGTLLDRRAMRLEGLRQKPIPLTSEGLAGPAQKIQAMIPRDFWIGSIRLNPPRIGITDLSSNMAPRPDEDPEPIVGLLGGEILGQTSAIIDFSTQSLYLKGI